MCAPSPLWSLVTSRVTSRLDSAKATHTAQGKRAEIKADGQSLQGASETPSGGPGNSTLRTSSDQANQGPRERGLSEQPRQEARDTWEAELGHFETRLWSPSLCAPKTVWTRRLIRGLCLQGPEPPGFHQLWCHPLLSQPCSTHKPSSHCGKHSDITRQKGADASQT